MIVSTIPDVLTIDEFCDFVDEDTNAFVDEVVKNASGRLPSDMERQYMQWSYPEVSTMLRRASELNADFGKAHVSLAHLRLEYRLPSAPAWCDVVLLGEGHGKEQVFIIELKHWITDGDSEGAFKGVITHKGQNAHHPSDQVQGYAEYCRYFHSAVQEDKAEVTGCVYITTPGDITAYALGPNRQLVHDYPVFNTKTTDDLANFLNSKIERGNEKWASRFIKGVYCQNRNILKQVAETFRTHGASRPFVLLEAQRKGFNQVMSTLDCCVKDKSQKQVIIVEGPPGSGKSAVAVNLWAESVCRYVPVENGVPVPGSVVYVTTNSSQKDNWSATFDEYSGMKAAHGFIQPANYFNPGMNGNRMKNHWVPIFKALNGGKYWDGTKLKFEYYEDYTNWMLEHGESDPDYADNRYFLSIVDEAHALINSGKPGFRCNKTSGWCFQMGPQAYHIIRKSRVSVFLMDSEQSYRDNETTTIADIEALAEHLGARVQKVSLAEMQFRCAGSVEYVDFVEHLFSEQPLANHSAWADKFDLQVVDTTDEMEQLLRNNEKHGQTVRILSSYTRSWASRGMLSTHGGEYPYDFDFQNTSGRKSRFQRYWNTEAFVRAPLGSRMCKDPLSEIGCPYMVRGYDYDYVGILSLGDLIWRKDKWYVDYSQVRETATNSSHSAAEKSRRALNLDMQVPLHFKGDDAISTFNATLVKAYRILLTRAVKGVVLYVHDEETRQHIRDVLKEVAP